jgi:altronate dehydratase
MKDNIDFDASGVIDGGRSLDEMGDALLDLVVETINGTKTKAESLASTICPSRD